MQVIRQQIIRFSSRLSTPVNNISGIQIHKRSYNILSSPQLDIPGRPPNIKTLQWKFDNLIFFKHKADDRIELLKSIIPEEYKLDDFILFKCLYDQDENDAAKCYYKDDFGAPVYINSENIKFLGRRMLKLCVVKDSVRPEVNRDTGEIDRFSVFDKMNGRMFKNYDMCNVDYRYKFIEQFITVISGKDAIKIETKSRARILVNIIGYMYFQLGSEKCSEFVNEFVINGRYSTIKNYRHKGLKEIYDEILVNT
ncbi:unnamed protein product [[Candida] boidinii]|nr:unnamed protein product [[Candida] boidinii]